ncbi:hypothetical protein AB1N83_006817 [Pleurotus pulmonarius]
MGDARGLHQHVGLTPPDNLFNTTYQPLRLAELFPRDDAALDGHPFYPLQNHHIQHRQHIFREYHSHSS